MAAQKWFKELNSSATKKDQVRANDKAGNDTGLDTRQNNNTEHILCLLQQIKLWLRTGQPSVTSRMTLTLRFGGSMSMSKTEFRLERIRTMCFFQCQMLPRFIEHVCCECLHHL